MAAHLRVFPGSLESDYNDGRQPEVRVSLGDLLPLLALAKRQNYLWLKDFLEDEVTVTPDLYEILQSCRPSRRPSA